MKPFLSLLVLTFQLPSHFSRFFPFRPVSPDFSYDVVRAPIGPKYHKHHQTHLFSKTQLHTTNYMVYFNCGASAMAGESKHINNRMVEETLTHMQKHAAYLHL